GKGGMAGLPPENATSICVSLVKTGSVKSFLVELGSRRKSRPTPGGAGGRPPGPSQRRPPARGPPRHPPPPGGSRASPTPRRAARKPRAARPLRARVSWGCSVQDRAHTGEAARVGEVDLTERRKRCDAGESRRLVRG